MLYMTRMSWLSCSHQSLTFIVRFASRNPKFGVWEASEKTSSESWARHVVMFLHEMHVMASTLRFVTHVHHAVMLYYTSFTMWCEQNHRMSNKTMKCKSWHLWYTCKDFQVMTSHLCLSYSYVMLYQFWYRYHYLNGQEGISCRWLDR